MNYDPRTGQPIYNRASQVSAQNLVSDFSQRLMQQTQRFGSGAAAILGLGPEMGGAPNITGDVNTGGSRVTGGQETGPTVTTGGGSGRRESGDPRTMADSGSRVTGMGSGAGNSRVTSGGGRGDSGNPRGGGGGGGGGAGGPGGRGPAVTSGGNNPTGRTPQGTNFSRTGMVGRGLGTALTLAPTVYQVGSDVAAGRPLDAAVTAGTSLATVGATNMIGGALMKSNNPYAKGAGFLVKGAGALLAPVIGNIAGNTAESARAQDEGIAPNSPSERERIKADRAGRMVEARLQADINNLTRSNEVAAIKDLLQYTSDLEFSNLQRNLPTIEKLNNQAMVRQQALMNTQTQNYAMLGTIATAGKLAQGAQRESGATLRTAMTNNPYANVVMQAPSISFG